MKEGIRSLQWDNFRVSVTISSGKGGLLQAARLCKGYTASEELPF